MKNTKPSSISRRRLLKDGAVAAVTGGAATLLGAGPAFSAQGAPVTGGGVAGRRYRAFMRTKSGPATIQEVTLLPLDPLRIVVRTEASMCCYSDTGRALGLPAAANGQGAFNQPTILGHGGLGIVEAVGSMVKRVQVGDRVMVPNTAQCGECYNCLRGRADQCLLNGQPPEPVARLADGTPVVQWNNEGGYSELMVPYENRVVPLFTRVPSTELAVLHCSGACGLGATMTLAPIEPASDVVIFGAGPLGLSAVQGARIKGAVQIIVVEPIRARRELALKVGATAALDPNAEGAGLVQKIRDMCRGRTDRAFAGGANIGAEWVLEAVGGDQFPPKAEAGPDPTGVQSLRQAWDVCSSIGHLVTVGINQRGEFPLPPGQWSNAARTHHPGNMSGTNSKRDMPRYARLIEAGLFDAKSMVTSVLPFDRVRDAFQLAADRTTVSSVITFS